MARADVIAANSADAGQYNGAGTNYVIRANDGTLFLIFVDRSVDVFYTKSIDGGFSWRNPISVFTGSVIALSVWYDRWSGLSTDIIHMVYTETGGNDILYRNFDATVETLSTQTTVFNGASAVQPAGALSITRGRDGTLRVAGSIDAGAEDGAWSSTDTGATWGDTIADPSEGATQDQYMLLPDFNADTADVQLIFWDASANELSVKRYDDSADTWTETSIAASMSDSTAGNGFPNMAATVDLSNSRVVVVAWSNVDTLNADLRCWVITNTTITETTANVVLNSTDDQGLCAIGIDTDTSTWYVFYAGKSDGSETWLTSVNVYYKTSTDAGATWSSETLLTNQIHASQWLACTPRFPTSFAVAYYDDLPNTDCIMVSVAIPSGTSGGGPLINGRLVQS
jgi:hypothetical protein